MAGLTTALRATVNLARSLKSDLEKAAALEAQMRPTLRIGQGGSGGKGFVVNQRAQPDDGGAGLRAYGGFG